MFNKQSVTISMPNGKDITITTGHLARQADGAVTLQCGDCIILATAVASKEPKPGQNFFPLMVDYQEKFASNGRIPGSFHRREGRLNEHEILISRLIDRALRPLFPDNYFCDVQILVSLISADSTIAPDGLACLAASAALAVSDIPIQEYVSEVRVAKINNEYVINPLIEALQSATMDFLIGATERNIMMVEGEAKECDEEELVLAIEAAHQVIKKQVQAQLELRAKAGIQNNRTVAPLIENDEIKQKVKSLTASKMSAIITADTAKHERSEALDALKSELIESFGEEPNEDEVALASRYFEDDLYHAVRNMILDTGKRLDGRNTDEIRPLFMEVDFLPSPHGSSLFTRGETQSLSTVTLGTKDDEQLLETPMATEFSKFMLHYNFPPFSTGEARPIRGVGRREVGHGNLAKRSLWQIMPKDFPYTVRIVSDILESNGSSSMATVCAGSLALMDAGVPFQKHVSGVAMGLISRPEDKKTAILTDILGDEDHLGDMDFKVTGTREGICGVQMDIKIDGLSMDLLREALQAARKGRLHILDAMYQTIDAPRPELKPQAPRIEQINVDREFIGAIIGPGGKVIQEIQRETGTEINIEEVDDHGEVKIFSNNGENLKKAMDWIKGIIAVPEVGETYESEVKSIQSYGAFIEFLPGKQGLLHISEVTWKRLESMEGVLSEGDKIKVKLIGLDPKTGKFRLSRKVLMPKPEGYVEKEKKSQKPHHKEGKNNKGGHRHNNNQNQHGAENENQDLPSTQELNHQDDDKDLML